MPATRRALRRPRRTGTRAEEIIENHRWKLSLLRRFISEHGWPELRVGTVVPPGVNLFTYVHTRRRDYQTDEIADWLVAECEAIPGWTWAPIRDRQQRNIDNLRAFVRAHGWEALTVKTRVDGVLLSGWAAMRRQERKRGTLAPWMARALAAIPDWSWEPIASGHTRNLKALRGHVARHGWAGFNLATTSRNGIHIGKWANHVRTLHRVGRLPAWLVAALESIPRWTWEPRRDRNARLLSILRSVVEKQGWGHVHARLVVRGERVGKWLYQCKTRHLTGGVAPETMEALESIPGFCWERVQDGARKGTVRGC